MTSASAQGWVQSIDPQTGRTFYANHITRKTQWDPPEGWKELSSTPLSSNLRKKEENDDENEPLPANWERMVDPTTGKPFYIDHERKITQWTRPKVVAPDVSSKLQPAAAAVPLFQTSNVTSHARPTERSYQQEMGYYYSSQPTNQGNVDLSDTMPVLEFKVETVSDALRPQCSHCNTPFSMSKRRHHCRLCGDVFCDPCSNHRCSIPLPGSEYEKPVRVCDYCFVDVEQGNFFSMRRYLTVLHLYEPGMEEVPGSVATTANVNAALSALTQDLDQMVSAADRLEEKMTIPAATLVPEILKHLSAGETADRAIRCIASLLSLESIAGKSDFAVAIYIYGKKTAVDDILAILERSGSSRKTLFVQEQAARTMYYLTESKLMGAVTRTRSELLSESSRTTKGSDEYGSVDEGLDIPRAIRNLLDHASTTGNPNLQRWSAATLKNLILEDQRRACLAVNEMAAMVASGEPPSALSYNSHLPELVSTGGVMILGSLIGADDADTRAHAVTALGVTLQSTRAVSAALQALGEMSGGEFGRTGNDHQDGDIVRAMVAAGGCAGSVAQLLLSADHSVAGMGCQFLSSLVRPLLVDVTILSEPMTSQYEYDRDPSSVGAYREAAIEIATGTCLPALLSLARETSGKSSKRPVELRWIAMEALTATIVSIGDMGRAWAAGQYEEGLERYGAPTKLKEAIIAINEEDIVDCALQILQSATLGQSLGTTAGKETPAARIRECAGMVLSSITSCSAEAITNVQSRNILSSLLLASTDSTMTTTSTIRGDGSPRCLGVLETVSALAMFSWQHPSGSEKDLLDTLIEMIDAGAIPYLSRVLRAKVDWESKDKAIGGMKARSACCRLLCCLFGIALTDSTGIGMRRLMDAVESDAISYRLNDQQRKSNDSRRVAINIVEATLGTLQTSSNLARMALIGGVSQQQSSYYSSRVMDLVETSLLAVGSMCGSSIAPGGSEGTLITGVCGHCVYRDSGLLVLCIGSLGFALFLQESFLESRSDSYISRRQDICNVACDVVVRGGRGEPTLLPTMVCSFFSS
jgi:FYVE zinc finger/WW domain